MLAKSMDQKVRWGVLGVADIAVKKVIPAMQRGECSQIVGIASRDLKKAQQAAEQLGIPKAYGSYEDLLADPEVEAIYNPLPNQLHVPWSIKAAEAGKHVLCEKPISLTVDEAISLLKARDRTGVKIEEAFMVRTHPQWLGALDLIKKGRIGELKSIMGLFSYFLLDPKNVRNILEYGGGGLMDIGCYLVNTSRFLFRRGTLTSSGTYRDRSGPAYRQADFRNSPISFRAKCVHLQHAALSVSAGPDFGHQRSDRDRDSLQCSH